MHLKFLLFSPETFFLLTLLPHFRPPPASPCPSAFTPLWKQLQKVEAKFASTYSKCHSFTITNSLLF
ncbi:hypothetical protein GAQ27_17660 [Bacteroides uniformis]|uniref:Uncharacterized protein n=1 Tax=Bacteroides uniformis TaxID=820 RepID=A0A413NKK3_BACUN|nr:hypothetical protein GAQ27_17660 [Bacteroides uniformis]KAB4170700.1 hypothetical protein GAQ31_17650 [Bacteroides uniformis]KAB4182543.1 hypothetical protein GAQ34_18035 [Bacteroides uniformis]KAB4204568.1 hypothetical protein GAQ04_14395 [Bacteroides uniformis]RGZ49070.1 hypothetical protein DW988_10105 [Bacteroides uniformis]